MSCGSSARGRIAPEVHSVAVEFSGLRLRKTGALRRFFCPAKKATAKKKPAEAGFLEGKPEMP